MKIRLQNFLCYTDTTFDFGNNGLTLISGPSGCGKTSILRGVFFALFGEGTKVQSYGKTSCNVELDIDDLKIIRTKRPNRLVVNDIYEDDVAQSIITTRFGTTFKSSGYIQQNNLTSFILMSPGDKLVFLEQFAFQAVDLGKIKGRCKNHITQLNDELLGTVAQLELSANIFEEMTPPDKVSFPSKCKVVDQDKFIKNEDIRLKNTTILIGRTEKTINQMTNEIHACEILDVIVKGKEDNIKTIDTKLTSLMQEEKDINYIGDNDLEILVTQLQKICSNREIIHLESSYKENTDKLVEMSVIELAEYQKEYDNIKKLLWSEYSKDDLESTIEDNIIFLEDINTLEKLRNELTKYNITTISTENTRTSLEKHQENLDNKQKILDKIHNQREIYKCPNCDAGLHMIDFKLTLTEGYIEEVNIDTKTLDDEIQQELLMVTQLKKQLSKSEHQLITKNNIEAKIDAIIDKYDDLPDIESIKDDITHLQQYKICQQNNEKRMRILQENITSEKLSKIYYNYKKSVDDIYTNLCLMRTKVGTVDTEYTEDKLRDIISLQENYSKRLKEITNLKNELNNDKEELLKNISNVIKIHKEKYGDFNDMISTEIKEHQDILAKLLEKKVIHQANMTQIELWKKYQTELKTYNEWKDKVSTLKSKEKTDRNRYTAATTLKTKILEAESMAITNIIDTINTHAREYLDCFFTDNPISVQLVPFKETKKSTKPCINMVIEYKGMECDLTMLSGGELSRVVLAYTLALSEMFNTPLLLLDECTSSLDQDLTNVVFDGIREHFAGKLVIIIAHQVIVGTFDKIINL
jgi:DNA repair exonuclease SbcCD ATPase subunit